ncbi:polyprenol phosphomannose-dependent alpha 1,6 mannosyltransferase MptB [Thermoactinospora rubra]|uniref:polyprenol phosphomannose-dependent alpha 1,6 mannosyltransferase MptB n=1 Tax=Thermoactinospora rubra TaxID=1088767 RepID=UPI000A0FFE62|nr:polyprenol phosphomannose-dependent alpha 1,6 mannosyltransferase MptB [Thermoactinospora rubra]
MRWERATRPAGRSALAASVAAVAPAASIASVLLTIAVAALGPSAMAPALPGPAWQPPYSLGLHPSPHLAVSLAAAAVILGGLGLLGSLYALHATPSSAAPPHGSKPATSPASTHSARHRRAGRLAVLGSLAAGILAFLPPIGSADHLNYAAYGRMVTLGLSPYTHGAADLPGDPIADAVEDPWREEPSVYGPVATAVQALAAWIGGDSLRLTIFVLAAVNAAAFIATGLLIDRFTRHDPDRRLRAALLWTANPLLLYHLVAGMHADTLAIACVVAALLARGRLVTSGVLLGLGVAVKLNAGIVALGPAWELRRHRGKLLVVSGVALAVAGVGYAIAGLDAFSQVSTTGKAISHASLWKLVQRWFWMVFGEGTAYRTQIQLCALAVMILLAWGLLRRRADLLASGSPGLASRPTSVVSGVDELAPSPGSRGTGSEPAGARTASALSPPGGAVEGPVPPGRAADGMAGADAPTVAAVLAIAYLFATPYILPWYDGLAFGLLAIVAASKLDLFVAAHIAILSLGYLPARVEVPPSELVEWLRNVVRIAVVPWALLALTALLLWWVWRAGGGDRRRRGSPPRGAGSR